MRPPVQVGSFVIDPHVRQVKDDAGSVVETWSKVGELWTQGMLVELWRVTDGDGAFIPGKSGVYFWGVQGIGAQRDPLTNVDPLALYLIPSSTGLQLWLEDVDGGVQQVMP